MAIISLGACDRLADSDFDFKSTFFKPYHSPRDILVDAVSIVIAPVGYSGAMVEEVLTLGVALFKDIFTSTPKNEAGNGAFEYKTCLQYIGALLLFTLLSPFINLAGLIGCSIASLFSEQESPKFDSRTPM